MLVARHRFFSKCLVKLIFLTFNGLRATNINPNKNDGLPVKITGYLMLLTRHRFFSKCRVKLIFLSEHLKHFVSEHLKPTLGSPWLKCRVKLVFLTFNGLRATNINPNKNDGLPTGYLPKSRATNGSSPWLKFFLSVV